ncbi:MAG TPA: phage holin family protein [Allosphingosinicella sp.]
MDAPAGEPQEESIGDLLGRLVEDGRAYAEAEIDLLKAIAAHRAVRARRAFILLAAGALLVFLAALALMFGSVMALAALIGPLWAGLAIFAVLAAGGYVLIRTGAAGVKGLARDDEEKAAIERAGTL